MRFLLAIVPLLVAGCATTATTDDAAPASEAAAAAPPALSSLLAARAGCEGVNAFAYLPKSSVQPYVPANWTFTSPPGDATAILRIFHAQCEDGALLVLSTPMFPDEASARWHENPDVVIDVFTTDEAEAARWTALGANGRVATFDEQATPAARTLSVSTGDGLALTLDVPTAGAPGQPYEWRAVYATGADEVAWFWGDEVSQATERVPFAARLGPATRLAGADAVPVLGALWHAFDLAYAPGLPPQDGDA